jgi:hypothetical protein
MSFAVGASIESMPKDFDPEGLFATVAGTEPEELRGYLAVMTQGSAHYAGTTIPVPTPLQLAPAASGLMAPVGGGPAPIDYMGVYLVLSDYVDPAELHTTVETLSQRCLAEAVQAVNHQELVTAGVLLNMSLRRETYYEQLQDLFRAWLSPQSRARFENALRPHPGQRRFLSRQPVLGALQMALALGPDARTTASPAPVEVRAAMVVHALAQGMGRDEDTTGQKVAGLPARMAVDLVCNGVFHRTYDLYSVIDRHVRLWRTYGHFGRGPLDGKDPAELVVEATGIEVEDFLALGFALQAHILGWNLDKPIHLVEDFSDIDPGVREAFLKHVAATPEEMQAILARGTRSSWDFLALQERPVLRRPNGMLVFDETFLMDRVTTGLYWMVHDHLRDHVSDLARQHWTQAWGAMIEAMVEDSLRALAPPIFGGGTTFFTEDDLAAAYGASKASDAVVDFGEGLAAVEIVSGQFTTATRIDGEISAFEKDMEKLLYKKLRQVDETTANLAGSEEPLTGVKDSGRPLYPVIVVGSAFSMSPVIAGCIDEYVKEEHLFEGRNCKPVSVIDLGEVEMLEGLAAEGHSVLQLLDGWHRSGIQSLPLHNWLLATFSWEPNQYRPPRMRSHVDATLETVIARLRLRDGPPTPDP